MTPDTLTVPYGSQDPWYFFLSPALLAADSAVDSFHSLCGNLFAFLLDENSSYIENTYATAETSSDNGYYNGTMITIYPEHADATEGTHIMRNYW